MSNLNCPECGEELARDDPFFDMRSCHFCEKSWDKNHIKFYWFGYKRGFDACEKGEKK